MVGEDSEVTIDLAGPEKLVLSGALMELVAARTMRDDIQIAEEQEEPEEATDEDEDETLSLDIYDIEEAVE